jgi:uncharacterized repeat protein (TIGR04076 family)
MPVIHKVVAKVISQTGRCDAGHKVGDEWVFKGRTPGDLCWLALGNMFSQISIMMWGGSFPVPDPEVLTVICPDRKNAVTFEIRRSQD